MAWINEPLASDEAHWVRLTTDAPKELTLASRSQNNDKLNPITYNWMWPLRYGKILFQHSPCAGYMKYEFTDVKKAAWFCK